MQLNNLPIGTKVRVWHWFRPGIGQADMKESVGVITYSSDYVTVLNHNLNIINKWVEDFYIIP